MKLSEFKGMRMTDLMTKTTDEIKKLVQWGVKMLNPRINRLQYGAESKRIADDAYRYIEQTGGLFSTVSDNPGRLEKTRNELLAELKREMNFANMRTSSVRGAREVQQERERIVGDKYGSTWDKMSYEERRQIINDTWEDYEKFRARHPNIPSDVLLDIYIQCNGMTNEMERKVQEWQYDEEQKWKQSYKQAEEQSAYKSAWQFNDL